MQEFDPALLRKLAARYRRRAEAEPESAELFLEIAKKMEADAGDRAVSALGRRVERAAARGPRRRTRYDDEL